MPRDKNNVKMIKSLRRRIVLIVTLTAGFVVVIALAAIMAMTYNNAYVGIHQTLTHAIKDGPTDTILYNIGKKAPDGDDAEGQVTLTYEEYRPCAVYVVDDYGNVLTSNEALVTMDDSIKGYAIGYALASSDDEGFISDAGLFFCKSYNAEGTVLAFVDATGFTAQMRSIGITLAVIAVLIIVALFLLSVLLARMVTRPVQQAWEQQAKFIADASHELKTPLTVLIANNDIMLSHPEFTARERSVWLEGSKTEAAHMKGLIEDMLTLARGEQAERLDPKDMPLVDMTALVERASLAFEAVAFERGVSVDEDIMPGVSIHGDEQELERLTKTLIDNAVKYADENGHVLVHLGRDRNGHATLSVNNSGAPIPKEDIAHVFDRFWRSDAARSRGSEAGGYGLGLSIAKNIADNHGAKMSVTSSSEKGTTFWVEF